jgi:hypothetical protein
MKNENEIKRAFAMEVIYKISDEVESRINKNLGVAGLEKSIKIVQSLLPKEEEIDQFDIKGSTESDEVKELNGVCCYYRDEEFIHVYSYGDKSWIIGANQLFGKLVLTSELSFDEPTLEQKARKKAEEIYYATESSQEAIYQALLIDPKTL